MSNKEFVLAKETEVQFFDERNVIVSNEDTAFYMDKETFNVIQSLIGEDLKIVDNIKTKNKKHINIKREGTNFIFTQLGNS